MTPQKAQIQALINDIDGVLGKASPRLPWVMSGDATQQRQVLEQTRNYLVSLQQQVSASEFEPNSPGSDLIAYGSSMPSGLNREPQPGQGAAVESAQQVLQAVLEEMNYLRANVMQPLRSDLDEMNQRRDSLIQELKQLEAERQQYALPQADQRLTAEFFQSLTARLREDLSGQVAQMVAGLESQSPERVLRAASEPENDLRTESSQSLLTPAERLKQLQMIQTQSDQLILKLDTTLRVVFDSLQDSVKSYQESLGQGLDRMHSLGQQGEAMFAALMNRLAEELGRGASSYLQSSIQTSDWEPRPTLQGDRPTTPGTTATSPAKTTPAQPEQAVEEPSATSQVTDAEIDKLLNELNAIAPITASEQTNPSEQTNIEDSMPAPVAPVTESDLEDLDLLTFELDDLPLDAPADADDDVTAFQVSDDFQLTEAGISSSSLEEIALFQQDDPFDLPLEEPPAANITGSASPTPTEPQIADLDSALDLLNQLSVELHEEPAQDEPEPTPVLLESAIAPEPPDEDEIDLPPTESAALSAAPVASPDNLYNQLDDLYHSIFEPSGAAATERSETRLTDLSASELAADLGIEPIATSPEPVQEANIPGDLVNEGDLVSESSEQSIDLSDDAFLSSELSDELFGGLSDPAETASLPPEVLLAETSADSALEDFSLDFLEDTPLIDPLDATDSIAADVPEMALSDEELLPAVEDESDDVTAELLPPPQTQPALPEEIDTIANLSDLLESTSAEVEPEAIAPTEDTYVTAAPDEDLLATEESRISPPVDLQLDPNVLQQLTADLSNLEGLQGSDLSYLEADLETPSPDWTLADWTEAEPTAEPSEALAPDPLLEEIDFLEPVETEPSVEPAEASIEAIATPDTSPIPAEPPDTIEDLFFPDTSDLSDLLSYQEALAAEVADQEISSFEDQELGTFADQELGTFADQELETFTSGPGAELPLLDQDTTLADLFDPLPDPSAESDLELEEDLLSDDFEDLAAPLPPQRETTLEDLFAIAEVDTTAPTLPSEAQTPDALNQTDLPDQSVEQSQPPSQPSDYDLALEDLFALPPDDFASTPLPEGEYTLTEQEVPSPNVSPSDSLASETTASETTLEELFDLSPPTQSTVPEELALGEFVPEVSASDNVPVSSAPPALPDESSSARLDFADFEEIEESSVGEEPDTFTLEGLDSLFQQAPEVEPTEPPVVSSNQVDELSDFEPPSSDLETNFEGWTLENAFPEPEPPVEYGSATDLDFLEALPPVEYESTTDLYTAEAGKLEAEAEYGSATDLPPFEIDSSSESDDLDFLGIEPPDTEDSEKKTLNSNLTEAFDPDARADAELAELTPDLIVESEPESETTSGLLPDEELTDSSTDLMEPKLESEIDLEITPAAELELVPEDNLSDSAIAPSPEQEIAVPETPTETQEDGIDDWSDRLPADYDPTDLPAVRLDDANPFPDIALLDPSFGLPGLEAELHGETPSGESADELTDKDWYLGIDFGTTGISAVLLNRSTCELYPIYWSEARPQ
ncbi:MAG: hypothetical protein HC840_10780, partial [Leptolyngbyaceae cyanobacterium RM2_2_4]|nr:hypothetical protein [Leptolyngbyaceae cyanobacterium RM2_2_4]